MTFLRLSPTIRPGARSDAALTIDQPQRVAGRDLIGRRSGRRAA